MVRGQLVFRLVESGRIDKGHHLMMVAGILAVPDDLAIKGEHQYVITEDQMHSLFAMMGERLDNKVHLTLHLNTEIDRTDELRGDSIVVSFLQAIWRV